MIYLSLIQNIALLVALTFLHGLLLRRIRHQGARYALVSGLLFGGVALVGMMTPIVLQPGLIFDGRSVVIAVAGLFGGPVTAGVAAVMAAGYRYWLGGVGAAMGVGVIIGAGGIGVIGYYLRRSYPGLAGLPGMYLFGLLVHLWMIGCTALLPSAVIAKTLATITLPVLVIYPLATLLVCQLFLQMERYIETERELETERRNLKTLVTTIPDLIWLKDAEGVYVTCNSRFEQFFGTGEAEVVGKTDYDFVDRELADFFRYHDKMAIEAGGPSVNEEWVTFARDGHRELLETIKCPVTDQYGNVTGVLGVGRNITERNQHEKALTEARYAAEAANRVKSEFLANMSHEIRTPMNGLLGMVQLMRYTKLNHEQEEYLQNMELCSSTLLSLISDILDLSKIEAGRIELEEITFPIRLVLEEVVAIQSATARQKSLQLELDLADDLPEQMQGDPLRFKQIILNLLGNAVKFTQQGGVTISACRLAAEQDTPARLLIAVRDTGIGISEEHQKQIFAPFTQADGTITRKFGGTGLGLTICKRLTELMGGRIRVESEPGKGSCFYVELPIAKEHQ